MIRDRLGNNLSEKDQVLVALAAPQVMPGEIVKVENVLTANPEAQRTALVRITLRVGIDQLGFADGIYKAGTPSLVP